MLLNNTTGIIAKTARLILREFQLSDAQKLYDLNSDSDVIRYTGDPPFKSISEAELFIKNYDHYQKFGFGRWACIRKHKGDFIGWCGLKNNEKNQIDLGFRFFKKYWNQGYATEAAKASLDFGFNKLGLEEITGRVAPENTASIRVLEKLNLKCWKQDDCMGIPDSHYYIITRINNKPKSI